MPPVTQTGSAELTDLEPLDRSVGLDQDAPGRGLRHRLRLNVPSPNVWLWLGVVVGTVVLQWPWMVLYTDVRYTFGALRVAGQAGISASDVFIHRPMANRLLMSGLDHLTFGSTSFRERLSISIGLACAGLVGAALARALRGWIGGRDATCVALATFAALAWAPTVTTLQPEWTATVLAVAGVAAGLASRRRAVSWHSAPMIGAGLLMAVAALQKYTTATTVAVALGVLLVLHWRRSAKVAAWTVGWTALIFSVSMLNSHESQWFGDMPQLNVTGGLNWQRFGDSVWFFLWLNPAVMLLPAAAVLGYRLSQRRIWYVGPALATVVVVAGVIVQNAFYVHHYEALSVFAAGLVTLACVRWCQRTGAVPAIVLLGAVWIPVAGWLARRPMAWRAEHAGWVVASVVVMLAVSTGLALGSRRLPRARGSAARTAALLFTASVLALLISSPGWPHTQALTYAGADSRAEQAAARSRGIEDGRAIREAAPGATVVYGAGQQAAYFVGLPTACSYPTPTFLARSRRLADPARVRSFLENVQCLRESTAEFLVLDPTLIRPSASVPLVRTTIAAEFDCKRPVAAVNGMLLCPRR